MADISHSATPGSLRTGVLASIFTVAILTLPVLDWRWMFGLASYARPLALFPILFGLAIFAITARGDTHLPAQKSFLIFSAFVGWALISTVTAIATTPIVGTLKGWTMEGKAIREVMGLGLGYITYFYFSLMLTTVDDARTTIKLLCISFVPVAIAAFIEAGSIYWNLELARTLDSILMQFRVQNQGNPPYQKIMGLAPEASMFADQLLSLFMPFSLAALLCKARFFRGTILGVSPEAMIFGVAVFLLLISGSRTALVGGAIMFVAGMICVVFFGGKAISTGRKALLVLVPIAVLGAAAASPQVREVATPVLASLAGVNDSIDAGVWSNITRAGNQVAGWSMFFAYPVAGVGTGGYAFHYAQYIPDWALFSPEVQAYLGTYDRAFAAACPQCTLDGVMELLPDPKGLLARIASETGVVGLFLMLAMWLALARRAWRAYREKNAPHVRAIGLGGLLSLISISVLTFNLSSYVWIHWYLVYAIIGTLPLAPKPATGTVRDAAV
jgi:hypothetical protein